MGNSPEELCRTHLSEAIRYACRLWRRDDSLRDRLDITDAESVAASALFRAAQTWDPAVSPFRPWMRKIIGFELMDEARAATAVGRAAMRKLRELAEAERILTADLGREPTSGEVAEFMGIDTDELSARKVLRNTAREAVELEEELEASSVPSEISEHLEEALAAFGPLTEDQRVILALHYYEGVPFKNIAEVLGRRPDHVSRLHGQAREGIRRFLENPGLA